MVIKYDSLVHFAVSISMLGLLIRSGSWLVTCVDERGSGRRDLSPRYLYAIYQNNISQKKTREIESIPTNCSYFLAGVELFAARWEMMCHTHVTGPITLQWKMK